MTHALDADSIETVREPQRRIKGTEQDVVEVVVDTGGDFRQWAVYRLTWNDLSEKTLLEPLNYVYYSEIDEISDGHGYSQVFPKSERVGAALLQQVRSELGYDDAVLRFNDVFIGGEGEALPSSTGELAGQNGDFEDGAVAAKRQHGGGVSLYKQYGEGIDGIRNIRHLVFTFADRLADWIEADDSDDRVFQPATEHTAAYERSSGGITVFSKHGQDNVEHLTLTSSEAAFVAEFIRDTANLNQFLAYQYQSSRDDDAFKDRFAEYLDRDGVSFEKIQSLTSPTVTAVTDISPSSPRP